MDAPDCVGSDLPPYYRDGCLHGYKWDTPCRLCKELSMTNEERTIETLRAQVAELEDRCAKRAIEAAAYKKGAELLAAATFERTRQRAVELLQGYADSYKRMGYVQINASSVVYDIEHNMIKEGVLALPPEEPRNAE